jgi:membrane-bound lytic murein transglycosylase A
LGYGGDNGYKYSSLGKMLVERKCISKRNISLSSIKKYYNQHPKEVEDLMLINERYIFFVKSDGLPRGSSGAVVEAFHSLATERFENGGYRFPVHQPMLIALELPTLGKGVLPVLCQDTGSAIQGEARADIYLGEGLSAERIAGELKNRGQMLILWPKSLPLPKSIGGDAVVGRP